MDYAGPFLGKMFLLMVDTHSKWLEVHMTTISTSSATITLMRNSFATLGLPQVIVSDNGTNFKSEEFEQFLQRNGIRHIRTPPCHPASNGMVERVVQTFKEGMKKLKDGSLETKLARFLFKYRITPHSTTGISPAELMFGRRLRSHLDNLQPNVGEKIQLAQKRQILGADCRVKYRKFNVGDLVYAKNFGSGDRWLPGRIALRNGEQLYTINLNDGRSITRHVDHLKSRVESDKNGFNNDHPTDNLQDIDLPQTDDVSDNEPEIENTTPLAEETGSDDFSPTVEGEAPTTVETNSTSESESDMHSGPRRSFRDRHPPDRYGHTNT